MFRLLMAQISSLGALLVVVASASPAMATGARSLALAQSPFFEDETDIFVYPASLVRYGGLISFDVELSPGPEGDAVAPAGSASDPRAALDRLDALPLNATGGVSFGDRLAGALHFGRAAPQSALAMRAFVFGEELLPTPRRLAEALVAYRLSDQHSLGARLGLAYLLDRTTSGDAGDNGVVSSLTELSLGHSWSTSRGRSDSSLSLELPYFRRMERFELVHQVRPTELSWTVAHRSLWPLARQWELGVSASLRRDSLSLSLPAASRSAGGVGWDLRFELGPRLLISEGAAVALSAMLERRSWKISELDSPPARTEAGGEEHWTLPGLRLAFEAHMNPWLALRTGLVGRVSTQSGLDGDGQRATRSTTDLRWQLGLGFKAERLRVDGVISARIFELDEGLGGESWTPDLFSHISLAYAF